MEAGQYEDMVSGLRRAIKSKKTFHYWMCPKGADGEPVFLIERKEGPLKKAAREARKTAKIKMAATGEVFVDKEGELIFKNEGKLDGTKVTKLFKTKLATHPQLKKIAAFLRRAKVMSNEEYEALAREAGGDLKAEEAEREHGGSSYPEKRADAEELYEEARDSLGKSHPIVTWIGRGMDVAAEKYEATGSESKPAARDKLMREAITKLDRVLEEGPGKLWDGLVTGWNSEALRVGALYKRARQKLVDTHGEETPEFTKAFRPLVDMRAEVNRLKKLATTEGLVESLDKFQQLEALCADVADPIASDVDEALALEEMLDGLTEDEALEQKLIDAERRVLALPDDEELIKFFRKAAEAFDASNFEEAERLLNDEVDWRLKRAERNKATADEIERVTGGGAVDLAKASIFWRDALTASELELDRWKKSVLDDPEIKLDPRYNEIKVHIKELAGVIPDFGSDLKDALDDVYQASGPERAEKKEAVARLIAKHRQEIKQNKKLQLIDDSDFGDMKVHAALKEALDNLETLLSKA